MLEAADETQRRNDAPQRQQAVATCLLGIRDEERIDRKDRRRNECGARPEQPATDSIQSRDAEDGRDHGHQPNERVGGSELQPPMQQQVVEGEVPAVDGKHMPQATSGVEYADRLVEPEVLGPKEKTSQDRGHAGRDEDQNRRASRSSRHEVIHGT